MMSRDRFLRTWLIVFYNLAFIHGGFHLNVVRSNHNPAHASLE